MYGIVVFFLACLVSACTTQDVYALEDYFSETELQNTKTIKKITPQSPDESTINRFEPTIEEQIFNHNPQNTIISPKTQQETQQLKEVLFIPSENNFINNLHLVLTIDKAGFVDKNWQEIHKQFLNLSPQRKAEIKAFYASGNYQPHWYSQNGHLRPDIIEAKNKINHEIYLTTPYTKNLFDGPEIIKTDYQKKEEILKNDLALTIKFLSAFERIRNGFTSLQAYGIPQTNGYKPFNLNKTLQQIDNGQTDIEIYSLTRFHDQYDALKHHIEKLEIIRKNGGYISVPNQGNLSLGAKGNTVLKIKQRLTQMGFPISNIASDIFDSELQKQIIALQYSRGMKADGVVGADVYRIFSRSVSEDIKTILVNIERIRRTPNQAGLEKMIQVNIPEMELRTIENGQTILSMKTIVGRTDRKTPIFDDNIEYVDFNPYWYVPYSLATKDILPKIKANPNYLSQNKLKVFLGNKEINPWKISWKNYNNKNFPYQLRQEPGVKNALGTVKFIFPNQHAVYLHDTPAKNIFDKASRSESSGCIRVAKPKELAQTLLRGIVSSENISKIFSSQKHRVIYLKQSMPISIEYLTAFIRDGVLHIRPDLYNYDNAMINSLVWSAR